MEFDQGRFIHAVCERTGLDSRQAATAVKTTFEALGRALASDAVAPVAALLPEPLAEHLRHGLATLCAGAFLDDLAAHEKVSLGFAKEHGQVVLEQLARLYDDETRELLVERLTPDLPEAASWLVPWEPPPGRRPHFAHPDDRTLAGGRPGSRSPLAEAAPDPGQHDSPAVTTDPHADTRLSSTRGISIDRSGSSIAKGRPGSNHPVSEKRE